MGADKVVVSGVDSVFLYSYLVVDYGLCCGHETGSSGARGSPASVSYCSLGYSCYFDCDWIVDFVSS